ncbi:MAG: GNAT family N-acetyltransferase [Planctomycetes bacterium]|nr:GNAT family N-acetyltransferase [Planctomycetota bacterium]
MLDRPHLAALLDGIALETERLRIRRFRPDDAPVIRRQEADPALMRFICDLRSPAEVDAKIEALQRTWGAAEGEWLGLPFELREARGMIGMVGTRVVSEKYATLEMGWTIEPALWRRGLTGEACRALVDLLFDRGTARKIIAYCVAENVASSRLMEHLGMKREGCLRQHSTLGEVWHDELVYGLFAAERPWQHPGR